MFPVGGLKKNYYVVCASQTFCRHQIPTFCWSFFCLRRLRRRGCRRRRRRFSSAGGGDAIGRHLAAAGGARRRRRRRRRALRAPSLHDREICTTRKVKGREEKRMR